MPKPQQQHNQAGRPQAPPPQPTGKQIEKLQEMTPPATTGAVTGTAPATAPAKKTSPLKRVTALLHKVVKAAQDAKLEHPAITEAAAALTEISGVSLKPITDRIEAMKTELAAIDFSKPGSAESMKSLAAELGRLQKKRAAITGE